MDLSISSLAATVASWASLGPVPAAATAATRSALAPSKPVTDSRLAKFVLTCPPRRRVATWLALSRTDSAGATRLASTHAVEAPDPDDDPLVIRYRTMQRAGGIAGAVPERSASVIELDLPRTFPDREDVMGPEGKAALRRVLHAYVVLDPEVGYVQGMNFVAAQALICAGMDEGWAFSLLCAIMGLHDEDLAPITAKGAAGADIAREWAIVADPARRRPGLREVYLDTSCGLAVTSHMVRSLLTKVLPRLQAHLRDKDVHPVHYFEVLLTLFSLHLPERTLLKAWTEYFRDGETAMLRLLAVTLADLEPYIMGEAGPELQEVEAPVAGDGADEGEGGAAAAASASSAPARPVTTWRTVDRPRPGDFSRTVYLLKAFSNYVQDQAADLAMVLREAREAAEAGAEYAGAAAVRRTGAPTPPPASAAGASDGPAARRPCGQLVMLSGGRASLRPRDDLVARSLLVPIAREDVARMRRRAERAVADGTAGAEVEEDGSDVMGMLTGLLYSGAELGEAALGEVQRHGRDALAGIQMLVGPQAGDEA